MRGVVGGVIGDGGRLVEGVEEPRALLSDPLFMYAFYGMVSHGIHSRWANHFTYLCM